MGTPSEAEPPGWPGGTTSESEHPGWPVGTPNEAEQPGWPVGATSEAEDSAAAREAPDGEANRVPVWKV